MSHELRTPLNDVIGFSEVLGEKMFGELNEKQDEYVDDIPLSANINETLTPLEFSVESELGVDHGQ